MWLREVSNDTLRHNGNRESGILKVNVNLWFRSWWCWLFMLCVRCTKIWLLRLARASFDLWINLRSAVLCRRKESFLPAKMSCQHFFKINNDYNFWILIEILNLPLFFVWSQNWIKSDLNQLNLKQQFVHY